MRTFIFRYFNLLLKTVQIRHPPLHQDWIPLTVATRKVDEFTMALIKLNKLNMQDLT